MITLSLKTMFKKSGIYKDLILLLISLVVTFLLFRAGFFNIFFNGSKIFQVAGSFIAGIFFASILTAAPGTAALGELSRSSPILLVAAFGALGSVVTDFLIFRFVRDDIAADLDKQFRKLTEKSIWSHFKRRKFNWLTSIIGAIIIASPLPDEIGLTLMGLSKMNSKLFLPLSFGLNFVGILAVGLIARSL